MTPCIHCSHPEDFHYEYAKGSAETEQRMCKSYGNGGSCSCKGFEAQETMAEYFDRTKSDKQRSLRRLGHG